MGADEEKDQLGDTALIRASKAGSVAEVEQLVASGADKEATDKWGRTSLMWAAREGHAGVASLLIEKGALLDSKDLYGNTAYVWAQNKSDRPMMELLLDAGVMYLMNAAGELIPRDMVKENAPEVKALREKLRKAGDMDDSKVKY